MAVSNSATVYIVDDDDAVRDSLCSLLESHGLRVRGYTSADDFLGDRQPSKIGCLLLDLHMPGMTGLQLLGKLRMDRSRLPVIAITGRSDPMLKKQVAQAGAFALLEKPMDEEVLLWTIKSAVAAQPPGLNRSFHL
jgi:two-component system, LuxR family, response regulator FixJ